MKSNVHTVVGYVYTHWTCPDYGSEEEVGNYASGEIEECSACHAESYIEEVR